MKIQSIRFFSFTTLLVSFIAISNCTLLNQRVQKAKDFMQAGMYADAIGLLKTSINENPNNAETYLLLGECYLYQGDYNQAKEQFNKSLSIKPYFSDKIGLAYRKAGDKAFGANQNEIAQKMYNNAIKYSPDIKEEITQQVYNQGKAHFENGEYDLADGHFDLVSSLDGSLSQGISDLYFDLGQAADEDHCIDFYRRAKKYSGSHDNEIGQRLLSIAYSKNSEEEIQKWRKEASFFIELPPDYILCIVGSNPFRLKKGEINKFWFRIPQGQKLTVSIYAYKNTYEVLNRDLEGNIRIYKIWQGDNLPSSLYPDIKIRALENILGEIIIRKKFIDD
jgi:tetratricopeptide (TPR) repeat protein